MHVRGLQVIGRPLEADAHTAAVRMAQERAKVKRVRQRVRRCRCTACQTHNAAVWLVRDAQQPAMLAGSGGGSAQ